MCKFIEKESILDANNVTVDTFSHVYNTRRENANTICTSEKLDKLDYMADALKDLTINDTKYYESDTATASDAQGDPTRNPKTVTHTSNENETVTNTRNGNLELFLSNLILPIIVPTINPRIYHRIAPIVVAPQTLLTPAANEVAADAVSGGAWENSTPQRVRRISVDGSTPCNMGHVVRFEHAPSPVLIGIFATSPPCGINRSLQVANKRQSTSPGLGGNTQKLDTVVEGKFPNYMNSASIFSKAIGHKLIDSSSDDLYLRCRMKL